MRFGKRLPNNPRMPKDGGAVLFFRGYKSYSAIGRSTLQAGFRTGRTKGGSGSQLKITSVFSRFFLNCWLSRKNVPDKKLCWLNMHFGKPLPNTPCMPKEGGAVLFFRGYKSYLAIGRSTL